MIEGGCYCRRMRYRVTGTPSHETNCHCSICRRTSAAPFVAWFTVAESEFRFTAGKPAEFHSTAHGTRTFCPDCGTPLTFRTSRSPGEVDVTVCSLDDPERMPPRDHTHVASRLSWVKLGDGLPQFPGPREPFGT